MAAARSLTTKPVNPKKLKAGDLVEARDLKYIISQNQPANERILATRADGRGGAALEIIEYDELA